MSPYYCAATTATRPNLRARIEAAKEWRFQQALPKPKHSSISHASLRTIDPNAWIPTTQLVEDTARLFSYLPGDIDAVLGIARSGLLPATQIAVMLHRPIYTVGTFAVDPSAITHCGGGWRMLGALPQTTAAPRKLLIVDDTAWRGIAMQRIKWLAARRWPQAKIVTAVIYAHSQTLHLLDFAACCYDGLHYLEWNLFNTGHVDPATGGGLVSDLDGIFCPDIAREDDDDGPRYLAAIRTRSCDPASQPTARAGDRHGEAGKIPSGHAVLAAAGGHSLAAFGHGTVENAGRAESWLAGQRGETEVGSVPEEADSTCLWKAIRCWPDGFIRGPANRSSARN